jgi:hypothetical protein
VIYMYVYVPSTKKADIEPAKESSVLFTPLIEPDVLHRRTMAFIPMD